MRFFIDKKRNQGYIQHQGDEDTDDMKLEIICSFLIGMGAASPFCDQPSKLGSDTDELAAYWKETGTYLKEAMAQYDQEEVIKDA